MTHNPRRGEGVARCSGSPTNPRKVACRAQCGACSSGGERQTRQPTIKRLRRRSQIPCHKPLQELRYVRSAPHSGLAPRPRSGLSTRSAGRVFTSVGQVDILAAYRGRGRPWKSVSSIRRAIRSPTYSGALGTKLTPDLLDAVRAEVLAVHPANLDLQLLVLWPLPVEGRRLTAHVVVGWGDLLCLTDWLDSAALTVSAHQFHELLRSIAKRFGTDDELRARRVMVATRSALSAIASSTIRTARSLRLRRVPTPEGTVRRSHWLDAWRQTERPSIPGNSPCSNCAVLN
jgi:hypothetical protein